MSTSSPPVKASCWPAVLDDLKISMGEQRLSLWFSNIRPLDLNAGTVTLGVPNLFVREWLESHFLGLLQQTLTKHLGSQPSIKFLIDPELFRQARTRNLEASAAIVEAASQVSTSDNPAPNIRPDFTLGSFIVGNANRFAYACAMEIIESQSNRLHPLFIHSRSGLGKTHLLQAIWHEINRRDDGRRAEYVSAETFTNQFIYAIRNHRLDSFRHRYRNAQVLLIDDVHFFSNKSGLQEELLHTYDALDTRKRQLILASDVHPKTISKLKHNLINRFASGMVVRMGQPDFSMRVAILKAKLHQHSRRLPEDVLRYVARGFEGNTRELAGAVTGILAYASLTHERIGIPLARKALARNGAPPPASTGALEAIEKTVARHYGLDPKLLRSKKQTRATRLPRQVCIYLIRKCTTLSCREIAHRFGTDHHSTIVFAVKNVEKAMKKDPNLPELVDSLTEEIKHP